MTAADAANVARLHRQEISLGLLSNLKPTIMTRIYTAFPKTSVGFGFVAERDGAMVGFITGTTSLSRLYGGIIWRQGLMIGLNLLRYLISPTILRWVAQTLRYPRRSQKAGLPCAELVSVAVQPGTGCTRSEAIAASAGIWMRTPTVLAVSLSFGTRKTSFP